MASIDGFQQQVKQDKWFRNLEDDMKLIIPYIEDVLPTLLSELAES